MRRNEMPHDLGIEGVSGDRNSGVTEQVSGSPSSASNARADADQREVAGAAPKVSDQNEFVVFEGRFVEMGRGNRLHFEVNCFKPGQVIRTFEATLGIGV